MIKKMNNLPTETIKEILGMVPDKTATHYDASCGYYWKITSPDGDSEEIYCFSEAEGLWIEEEYSYAEHNLNDLREILALRESQPKWISVGDRMPETNENVLTWGGHHETTTLWFDDSDEKWKENDEGFTEIVGITHWMPLPEPPTGREQ